MLLCRIQEPFSKPLQMCLIFAECAYSSDDGKEIWAEFSWKQFKLFSLQLWENFQRTVFCKIIEI